MDEARMRADLAARLAALERQHGDQLALFRAAIAMGQLEGRMAELRLVISGLDGTGTEETDDNRTDTATD
jgi:hypothetical protein